MHAQHTFNNSGQCAMCMLKNANIYSRLSTYRGKGIKLHSFDCIVDNHKESKAVRSISMCNNQGRLIKMGQEDTLFLSTFTLM